MAVSTASPNALTDPVSMGETEWNETKLMTSLARLQEMHIQLRQLRNTFPTVLQALLLDHASPENLYCGFAENATYAAKNITAFVSFMEDDQSRKVLNRSKESRAENKDGIAAWMVTQHADWLNHPGQEQEKGIEVMELEDGENVVTSVKVEDLPGVLENFRVAHPGFEITLDEATNLIRVNIPAPANLHFLIESKTDLAGQLNFNVTSRENSPLHAGILHAISSRQRQTDLSYLLDMMTSFADIKSRPCLTCSRLVDPDEKLPTMRIKKRTKMADGRYEARWQAFHALCA